jgi:hypothetical protein
VGSSLFSPFPDHDGVQFLAELVAALHGLVGFQGAGVRELPMVLVDGVLGFVPETAPVAELEPDPAVKVVVDQPRGPVVGARATSTLALFSIFFEFGSMSFFVIGEGNIMYKSIEELRFYIASDYVEASFN